MTTRAEYLPGGSINIFQFADDDSATCGKATITVSAWVGSSRRTTSGDIGCGLDQFDSVPSWAGVNLDTSVPFGDYAFVEFSVLRTEAARKSRKKITKVVRWKVTSTGGPVLLAGTDTAASGTLRLTAQFVSTTKTVTRRIWADTNRDSFYNYCLNFGKKTYSSGGRIYCWYWKPGVRAHWNETTVELKQ
jgi:hypothetical protein